jgi:ASPM-SPD-2-Hydin domain-containing protein/Kelch motif protein
MNRKGAIPLLLGLTVVLLYAFLGNSVSSAQTGVWVQTGNMTVPRWGNSATLLASGKVLVVGGCSIFTPPNVCNVYATIPELYDPAAGTWTATNPPIHQRGGPSAALMQDGRVLVAGGDNPTEGCMASAELFDPATEQWTETGAMSTPRCGFQTVLIEQGPNAGMVMAISGSPICQACEPVLTTAELYDPATGIWTLTGSLAVGRFFSIGSVPPYVGSGNIMAVGGMTCCAYTEINEAEVYDVLTGQWTPTSDKATRGEERGATLNDSNVLVAGGWTGTEPNNRGVPDTELFNAATGAWSGTASMSIDRFSHTLTTLASGQVLVVGGCDGGWSVCRLLKTAELYDAVSGAWFLTGSMNFARSSHNATLLPDGRLLVSGGFDPTAARGISTAELFIPPPAVALSSATLKFSVQLVGTPSATQTITLTVPGSSDLHITSIAATGDFLQRNTCGSSVSAGGSCAITVAFKPTQKNLRSGSITITDDAINTPQTIGLSGTGTVVALSSPSLGFGDQPVGNKSHPQTIKVTNVGTDPVNFSGFGITGKNPGDFAEITTCGAPLTGGASCTISVTFTPQAKGCRQASLVMFDNGGGSPQKVSLMGTGT